MVSPRRWTPSIGRFDKKDESEIKVQGRLAYLRVYARAGVGGKRERDVLRVEWSLPLTHAANLKISIVRDAKASRNEE